MREHAPHVYTMQAHVCAFLLICKLTIAFVAGAIGALVLAYHPDFAAAEAGSLSSIYLPVVAIMIMGYVLGASFVGVLEIAVAAAVQGWCVDYKQNCVDQGLSETWMMAAEARARATARAHSTHLHLTPRALFIRRRPAPTTFSTSTS